MNDECFFEFIRHFQMHTKSSKESPVVLILDNFHAHLHIGMLDYAKEHGITIIALPPHTTYKLMPHDRKVFKSLKCAVNTYTDVWMRNNAGRTMSIYDIPSIIKDAWPVAVTPGNIISGFEATGMWPFNPNRFGPADFAPSTVADRPMVLPLSPPPTGSTGQQQGSPSPSRTTGPTGQPGGSPPLSISVPHHWANEPTGGSPPLSISVPHHWANGPTGGSPPLSISVPHHWANEPPGAPLPSPSPSLTTGPTGQPRVPLTSQSTSLATGPTGQPGVPLPSPSPSRITPVPYLLEEMATVCFTL